MSSPPPLPAEVPSPSSDTSGAGPQIGAGNTVEGESHNTDRSKSRRFSQPVFWFGLCSLIAAASTLLLMPVPFRNERLRELCDLAHLPLFAALTWSTLMWRAWRDAWKPQSATWKVALFWLIVGSVLEFSQKFFDRGTSWEDAIANAIGIVIGISVFHAQFKNAGHYRIPLFALALFLFVTGWGWSWYLLWQSYR